MMNRVRTTGGQSSLRAKFEAAALLSSTDRYVLRLYVSGMTARSAQAIEKVLAICDEYLYDRYDLEVVDTYDRAALPTNGSIVSAPLDDLSGFDLIRRPGQAAVRRA